MAAGRGIPDATVGRGRRCAARRRLRRMLMIIFGAGATHGAIPGDEVAGRAADRSPPPVTASLFSREYAELAERYPSCIPIIARLRRSLAENRAKAIELEISRLAVEAGDDPEFARQFLSLRFYLAGVIESATQWWFEAVRGATHYVELLARVGAWRAKTQERVALVTLNYDRMLDLTLERQTGELFLTSARSFDAYINRDDWRLYKLHGSTSWCRVVDTGPGGIATRVATNIISRAETLDIQHGRLYPVPWEGQQLQLELRGTSSTRNVAVPAIAVPVDGKIDFECPADHAAGFRSDANLVTHLLIVGWRAAEPHVLETLKNINPHYHLAVVDPNSHQTYDALDAARINPGLGAVHTVANRAVTRTSWPSFEALLHDGGLDSWLARPIPWPGRHEHELTAWTA